jgi:hypothetical protein
MCAVLLIDRDGHQADNGEVTNERPSNPEGCGTAILVVAILIVILIIVVQWSDTWSG